MPRARDILDVGILPSGPLNAITDVPGVRVGHATIRQGNVCTGVTAVLPHDRNLYREKVTAATAVLNGYGKSVGMMQIDELGTVESPILVTSTLNVPRVADALIGYMLDADPDIGVRETVNPVVLECFDGYLSDARARAVGKPGFRKPSRPRAAGRSRSGASVPAPVCAAWATSRVLGQHHAYWAIPGTGWACWSSPTSASRGI